MKGLKNVLLPQKTVTIEYPGLEGLEFDLTFLSKEEISKIMKKCTKRKVDPKTRQVVEEVDDDMFLATYIKAIVKGWRGFKFKYLSEFTIWDANEVEDEEEEIEFDIEDAIALTKASPMFDNWVSAQIEDLGNFTAQKSKPNLSKSKDTSSTAKVTSMNKNT
jgi:hypothetical protein